MMRKSIKMAFKAEASWKMTVRKKINHLD